MINISSPKVLLVQVKRKEYNNSHVYMPVEWKLLCQITPIWPVCNNDKTQLIYLNILKFLLNFNIRRKIHKVKKIKQLLNVVEINKISCSYKLISQLEYYTLLLMITVIYKMWRN